MKRLMHFIYKLKHYLRRPAKVEPREPVVPKPTKTIMQQQVDVDTAMELARQWDNEDVTCPPHKRPNPPEFPWRPKK